MKKLDYIMELESLEIQLRRLEVSVSMLKLKDADQDKLKEAKKLSSKKVIEAMKGLKSVEGNIWKEVDGIEKKKFSYKSGLPKGMFHYKAVNKIVEELDRFSEKLEAMGSDDKYTVIISVGKTMLSKQKSTSIFKKSATALDVASETISELLK